MILLLYLLIGLFVGLRADSEGNMKEDWIKYVVLTFLVLLWFPVAVACAAWRLIDQ